MTEQTSSSLLSLEANIGLRVRQLRKMCGLTINELAALAGVSAGAISQIERHQTNPTVRMLEQLRIALRVPLTALLDSEEPQSVGAEPFVRRQADRPHFHVGESGVAKEMLSPNGEHDLQFMLITIPAGSGPREMLMGSGEKAGLLVEGELILTVSGDSVTLAAGDSFQFKSHLTHSVFNQGSVPAKVLWIMQIQQHHHL